MAKNEAFMNAGHIRELRYRLEGSMSDHGIPKQNKVY